MKSKLIKSVLLCACLMLIMQMATGIGYAKVVRGSIMGMWLLNEGSGDVVKDSSGNKNDGTIVGAKWVDGKIGKALAFDGASHVEIPASKTTDDIFNGFTYLLWVKPTGTPKDAANTRLIERDWHNPTIQIGATDFYGSIAINADQASTNVRGGLWTMNEWSFVALTYDKKMIHLYVDGEMVNEKEVGEPDKKPHSATPAAQAGSIWLGAWKAAGWDYIGVIDEVAVFNVALSEDDINTIMTSGLEKASAVSDAGKIATAWAKVKCR